MASSNGKVLDLVWIHNFAALIFPHVSGNGECYIHLFCWSSDYQVIFGYIINYNTIEYLGICLNGHGNEELL